MPLSVRLFDPLLYQVFPPRCVACGPSGALLCASCQATICAPEPPLCNHFGVSPAALNTSPNASVPLCRSCATRHGPASLTSLRVAAVYDGVVRAAILALTFHRQRRAAQPMASLLATEIRRAGWRPDIILSVPLHPDRSKWRGYNQTDLLARRCAAEPRVAQSADLLIRQRDTRPQVGLTIGERHANVSRPFALASPPAVASALLPVRPVAIWGPAFSRSDLASDTADASSSPPTAYHIPTNAARRAR